MQEFLEEVAHTSMQSLQRRQRGCRRRATGCLVIVLLLLTAACGLLFVVVQQSGAAPAAAEPMVVYFLVDNSNSVFTADPDLMRLEAVRLFITYLALTGADTVHTVGVIYFGGESTFVVAPTQLDTPQAWQQVLARLDAPPRMDWTDPAAALEEVRLVLTAGSSAGLPVVILLTDGRPEWDGPDSDSRREAYGQQLQQAGRDLAAAGAPVHVILLGSDTADERAGWLPVWQQVAAAHPDGSLTTVFTASALMTAYHDLAAMLTGRQTTDGIIHNADTDGHTRQFLVPPGLAHLTLVAVQDTPTQGVEILLPNSRTLNSASASASHQAISTADIWFIAAPPPGLWTLQVAGAGRVMLWQDYDWSAAPVENGAESAVPPIAAATAVKTPVPTAVRAITPATPLSMTQVIAALPTTTLTVPTTVPESAAAAGPTPRSGHWLWGGGLLVLAAFGTAGWWYSRRQRPVVVGTLRAIAGPGFADGRRVCELEPLGRQRVTIGAMPADVPLVAAAHQIVIEPGPGAIADTEMWVSGSEAVMLDGTALVTSCRLEDAAMIQLGDHVLRYENLRWRRALRTTVIGQQSQNHLPKVR